MLEGLEPVGKHGYCKIADIKNKLEKKDQEILDSALGNPDWTNKGLARELTKRGITISDTPIGKHRNGNCYCARKGN